MIPGVEEFAFKHFGRENTIFDSCVNLIVYAYSQLERNKTYSRQDILNQTSIVRNRIAKKIELEDYLRNDLVTTYIEPNRHLFELDYYLFQSGAEEFHENIKTGILDIKVCSPLYNGTVYYIFECKRLNKALLDNYVNEGILRFVNNQYYPESETDVAGIISFLESEDDRSKIDYPASFLAIDTILKKHKKNIKLRGNLNPYNLSSSISQYVNDFKYIYMSKHNRNNRSAIAIYHIVLNYNHLIRE